MDYKRIYAEFIKDRRTKESLIVGYSEKHHIKPRSLGGGDEPDNLIRLTPEDHFFAHLLLAKIHGAQMACALFLLVENVQRHWKERLATRRAYGFGVRFAARIKSEQWTAEGNPLFNSTRFQWANYRTGERVEATLSEMHARYGAARSTWTSVLSGHSPSVKGWLPAERMSGHTHSEKGQAFTFINRDGRSFDGTQAAFAKAHRLNAASASRVVRGQSVTRCGWRLAGVKDRPANYAKDGLPAHTKRRDAAIAT